MQVTNRKKEEDKMTYKQKLYEICKEYTRTTEIITNNGSDEELEKWRNNLTNKIRFYSNKVLKMR